MRFSNILPLFLLVTVSSSQYTLIQTNDPTTDKKFSNNMQMVPDDLKESTMAKKKAMIDTEDTISITKYGILTDLKKINNQLVTTLVDNEMGLDAIKVIKFALLNLLSTQIQSTMEKLQNVDISNLLESPILNFIMEILLPILSEKDSRKICNVLFPDLPNSNDAWLHENPRTSVTHEGKSISTSMKSLFEDTSSATSKESSVRKILKL